MTTTYTLIASNTVGLVGASSVTFSSIPATYTDFVLKASLRSTSIYTAGFSFVRINGNSSSIYNSIALAAEGGSPSSETNPYGTTTQFPFATMNGTGTTANTFNNCELYIPNYASSNYKSISVDGVNENNSTSGQPISERFVATLFSSTSAISSLYFYDITGGNFTQYSTFYLYGISNS
jgi:hypothetical protein